jgi:hypothetical protein
VGGDSNMRTAVNTRVVEDPLWGGKASGTAGRSTFALLAAGDEAPGRQAPGEEANPFLGQRKGYFIGRGQYSIGSSNYAGALLTDTQFGSGHNSIYYDPEEPYSGRERSYQADVSFQPSSRFNQSVSWSHVRFDRASTGENVYTVDILNTRTTFQFDRHSRPSSGASSSRLPTSTVSDGPPALPPRSRP